MRQLQSPAEQDRDDWGAWLKWTPMGVYALLLFPHLGLFALAGCLCLFGAYYAATKGMLMALASETLPQGQLTSTAWRKFSAGLCCQGISD
jgi:hypothetical protein